MKTADIHILLVDDEPDILEILDYNLSKAGYQISRATNGKEALAAAQKKAPDLVILDMMMPEMDGIETCKQLRKIPSAKNSIILFLTALGEDETEMAGYGAGADDYITKPVRPKVLVSKVKALLRRLDTDSKEGSSLHRGDLSIDLEAYKVIYQNQELKLPRKEFELLKLLASKPGKVFTREKILNAVWGQDVIVGDRTIDVHIRKLREKITAKKIETVKGVGYKFVEK